MRRIFKVALVVANVCLPAAAMTQNSASDRATAWKAQCGEASARMDRSTSSSARSREMTALLQCGKEGAAATARALAGTRSMADVAVLRQYYYSIDGWRDADVMAAALTMAQDRQAATPARVFAVKHLLGLLSPGTVFSYDELIRGSTSTKRAGLLVVRPGCHRAVASGSGNTVGTPLPSNYGSDIQAALARLSGDRSAPAALRNAAACGALL
jgi:hypothetical protein